MDSKAYVLSRSHSDKGLEIRSTRYVEMMHLLRCLFSIAEHFLKQVEAVNLPGELGFTPNFYTSMHSGSMQHIKGKETK